MWKCDLSNHFSQTLSRDLINKSNLVLALAPEHLREIRRLASGSRDKSFLLENFPDESPEGEGVDDPIGASLDRYNETFLEIGEYLGKHLPEIVKRIDEHNNA